MSETTTETDGVRPEGVNDETRADDAAGDEAPEVSATAAQDQADDAAEPADDSTAAETAGASDAERPRAAKGRGLSKEREEELIREGEIAADYLETLLDIADLDGDLDVDVDGERASVAIVDSEDGRVPRRLIGPRGQVLEALQELARLAVQAETGDRSWLMLDVAGHRAGRKAELVRLAREVVEEVKADGSPVAMDPMTAFERKVVHDEILAAGLRSESEGVEPNRHVVVSLA